ncbi:hypothetical protein FP2506_04581 [Fulvimarina pelagi HTCC2506]|uniref:Uncharacterized protein n=1 Tax=Fulvimarina pelagi HTCC2506 TaxID=314231 RepID=Q0FZW6_9HYPH|nr:hypothetical protein FP2506_04581 [Fulvimarina pelagi HTCC2506]
MSFDCAGSASYVLERSLARAVLEFESFAFAQTTASTRLVLLQGAACEGHQWSGGRPK